MMNIQSQRRKRNASQKLSAKAEEDVTLASSIKAGTHRNFTRPRRDLHSLLMTSSQPDGRQFIGRNRDNNLTSNNRYEVNQRTNLNDYYQRTAGVYSSIDNAAQQKLN